MGKKYDVGDLPNPGSRVAVERGCTCAQMDNAYGEGIPGSVPTQFWISGGCPLHDTTEVSDLASKNGEPK